MSAIVYAHRKPDADASGAIAALRGVRGVVQVSDTADPGQRCEVYVADPNIDHRTQGVAAVEALLDEVSPGWRSVVEITG